MGRAGSKNLDALPKDFFAYKFTMDFPSRRPSTLFLSLFLVFFPLAILALRSSEDYPRYLDIVAYTVVAMYGLSAIPCIMFRSRKRIDQNVPGFIIATMFVNGIFQIEFWMTLTLWSVSLLCQNGRGGIDPGMAAITFLMAVSILIEGVVVNILMVRRMKRRILEGQFCEGGEGFWGNWRHKQTIYRILMVACPIVMALGSASVLISKFWHITWDMSHAPVIIIGVPLLLNALFIPMSYGNALSIFRRYYVKRFDPQLQEQAAREAEEDAVREKAVRALEELMRQKIAEQEAEQLAKQGKPPNRKGE